MSFGLLMFFVLLTFAVQMMYNVYATSVITSLALEAARDAAEDGGDLGEAEAEFLSNVGGEETNFSLQRSGGVIEASIRWESNTVFPALNDSRPFGVIDRTFVVRVEEQQPLGP